MRAIQTICMGRNFTLLKSDRSVFSLFQSGRSGWAAAGGLGLACRVHRARAADNSKKGQAAQKGPMANTLRHGRAKTVREIGAVAASRAVARECNDARLEGKRAFPALFGSSSRDQRIPACYLDRSVVTALDVSGIAQV